MQVYLFLQKRFIRLGKAFFPIFCLVVQDGFGQSDTEVNYGKESFAVVKLMENYHFSPPALDVQFSSRIYKLFIKELDGEGVYLTQAELDELSPWQYKLDGEINNCSATFIGIASNIYRKCLNRTDSLITLLLSKSMDFTRKDTFYYAHYDSAFYSPTFAGLEKRWNRYLKYSVLSSLYNPTEETPDPFSKDLKVLMEQEPLIRQRIQKRLHRHIQRILENPEGFKSKVSILYLDAITTAYDPHSEFFSPVGKAKFSSYLATDITSFGLSVHENANGESVIDRLAPGGSAWKSNQFHTGDVILKMKVGTKKTVDLSNLSEGEIDDLFNSILKEETTFTIRSENGQVKSVVLVKTKMRSEENAVKSFILKGDKPLGYISLPSFYTDETSRTPLGCANDVAKEIFKLQDEHIMGLILDLRSNGGGSVYEAIALAGLFIDEGALCIYKRRTGKPVIIKDMNRGMAYKGPLLVMVNGESASASELFAGIMKDYRRGIVTGQTTFGKATGQTILPLDSICKYEELFNYKSRADKNERAQFGFVKVTLEKFYNLGNTTHQKQGIQPDIALPQLVDFNAYRESTLPYALERDSIVKKVIYNPLPPIPVNELSASSKSRILKAKAFVRLGEINDSLQLARKNEKYIILQPGLFKTAGKRSAGLLASLKALVTDSLHGFTVKNNAYEESLLKMDTDDAAINEEVLKSIREDIYIDESRRILEDWIGLSNK